MSNETEVTEQLPNYVIEGARSSRSKCKVCRRAINKGTLRLSLLIEGPYGTGYLWHHLKCAARRRFESVEEAYGQEAWKEAKDPPKKVPPLDELRQLREEAEDRKKKRKTIPYVEEAPSARSKCKRCQEPIEKGALRVILGRGVYFGNQVRTSPIMLHAHCVSVELEADDCMTEIPDFEASLRANSEGLSSQRIDELMTRIGKLPDAPETETDSSEGAGWNPGVES